MPRRGRKAKPTLNDIAEEAGVSTASVSRYLRGRESLSERIRLRIEEALQRLEGEDGWSRPRHFRQDRILGAILPDMENPFFPALLRGIESVTKVRGYDLLICVSEGDVELEGKQLSRLIEIGTTGLIYVPSSARNEAIDSRALRARPIVFLDRVMDYSGVSSVVADNADGAWQATKYLLGLGHRRVLYLTWPMLISSRIDRYQGFTDALKDAGVPSDWAQLAVVDPSGDGVGMDNEYGPAYRAVTRLLESAPEFTAIFAAADVLGLAARDAVLNSGRRVPEDISIIAYDDVPYAQFVGLTTIAQPTFELGSTATVLLIDMVEGRVPTPRQIVLRSSIVIRSTCARVLLNADPVPAVARFSRATHQMTELSGGAAGSRTKSK